MITISERINTISSIINEYQSTCRQIDDIEGTLKSLRKNNYSTGITGTGTGNSIGNNWEVGIEKDERISVKLLYDQLVQLRSDLDKLMSYSVYGLTDDMVDRTSHGCFVDVRLPLIRRD